MKIYPLIPTDDERGLSSTVTAVLPRGACVIETPSDSRVLWVDALGERKVHAPEGIASIEAGLVLEDLTAAQLKALAKAKGVKTSGKKAGLVARVRTALEAK